MIKNITSNQIIHIHKTLVKSYGLTSGKIHDGKIQSILFKMDYCDDNVIKRASILLEGLIRLHVFVDGNKRTALQSTRYFLNHNGYVLLFPLSTVAFIHNVATTQGVAPEENDNLIKYIESWLQNFSIPVQNKTQIYLKYLQHYIIPLRLLRFFDSIHLKFLGTFILKKYLKANIKNHNPELFRFVLNLLHSQILSNDNDFDYDTKLKSNPNE